MVTFISHSPAETESLGERFGRHAQRGAVFALSGELGAGKTQFVKGLARGLGIAARVHSPTFTLVNEYGGGRLKLSHLDLYRLETREQILSAGLADYLTPDGVSVIEWAERLGEIASKNSCIEPLNPNSSLAHPRASSLSPQRGEGPGVRGENCNPPSTLSPGVQGEVRVPGAAEKKWISVKIEIVNETERKIIYDDFGA